jgi:hypothetical protein
MKATDKTFCDSHYRHLRLLFLVDSHVSGDFLEHLFMHNYQLWGGRYNPVIPVNDQRLSPYYSNLIGNFDPDIVYYTEQIGLEAAQRICENLHPKELIQLDPNGRDNFPGVYAHYLLPEAQRQATRFMRSFELVYFQRHEVDTQTSFYNLSFGITNQYVEDITLANGYNISTLDVTNIGDTNRRIAAERPFFNCFLSTQQAEYTYLRPSNEWEFNCLELVVYDEGQPFEDLIYFWNRALSQNPRGEILQLIASRQQLELLMGDKSFFGNLLQAVARDNSIYLHSLSLPTDVLEGYRATLQASYPGVAYRIAGDRTFPRILRAEKHPYRRELSINKNLLLGNKDHLRFPAPNWSADHQLKSGYYVYDAEFYRESDLLTNQIKFPYDTTLQFVLGLHDSRVNKDHHVSFFLSPEKQTLDIHIPTTDEIFNCRLHSRTKFGASIELPTKGLRIGDAGLKLRSFVNLFDGSLISCAEVLMERFWVDLILGQSTGARKKQFEFKRIVQKEGDPVDEVFRISTGVSNIHNNDGTFNHLDLESERHLIYLEHAGPIREFLVAHDQLMNDDELIAYMIRSEEEDFKDHIDPDLQYLIDRDALFIGMKVKCKNCGSNSWYNLAELKNKMSCKGCLQEIIPALESRLYYRFNDIVYNNLSSDSVKREKTFHGNYIVLRTLAFFASRHHANYSFNWSPCLDIAIKSGNGYARTDIDLAMIDQGKLIIGEAKASASDFNAKQFEQLCLMLQAIKPDVLILAYLSGNINGDRLNNLKIMATEQGTEVIVHQVEPPEYHLGNVR